MANVEQKAPFWFSLKKNKSEKLLMRYPENTAHLDVIYI